MTQQQQQQFTGLQILRFVAAMLVAVMHVTQGVSIYLTGQGAGVYWGPGSVGVDIFFVISGFVMAISTRPFPERGAYRMTAAWIFVKRRILRIVPLYWFYTLLKAALLLAVPALAVKSTIDPTHLAASLLFVPMTAPWGLIQPTLPVGWTLNFEMLFYAVFALAIALGAPRIRFCLIVFLSIFLAGQYFGSAVPLQFFAQSIIFEFILGVCIAYALTRWGSGPAIAGALLVAIGTLFLFGIGWNSESDRLWPWGVGAAAVVLGTVWLEPLIVRAPLAPQLSFLGDASYSIYLSHTFVVPAGFLALRRLGLDDPMTAALLVTAMVIAAGAISHVWLEKPMIAFFKRFLFPQPKVQFQNAANTPLK